MVNISSPRHVGIFLLLLACFLSPFSATLTALPPVSIPMETTSFALAQNADTYVVGLKDLNQIMVVAPTWNTTVTSTYTSFGASVALSDALLVVGAPAVNNNQGSVYIYTCNPGACTLGSTIVKMDPQELSPDDAPVDGDLFGSSVAVFGSFVLIGAEGVGGVGKAYLWDCTDPESCTLVGVLENGEGADGDRVGASVAFSESEATLFVGAPGGEYVAYFSSACTGNLCPLIASLDSPDDVVGFGTSLVALNDALVVGSIGNASTPGQISYYACNFTVTGCTTPVATNLNHVNGDSYGISLAFFSPYLAVASNFGASVLTLSGTTATGNLNLDFQSVGSGAVLGSAVAVVSPKVIIGSPSLSAIVEFTLACAAESAVGSSGYPATPLGGSASPACNVGFFSSSTTRTCGTDATFSADFEPCFQVNCTAGSDSSAAWVETPTGSSSNYTCEDGYFAANPTVECTFDGTATGVWGSNPCTRVHCDAGDDSSATWIETPTGSSSNYTCEDGYFAANPTVECTFDGTATGSWGSNPCTRVHCDAGEDDSATWDETLTGSSSDYTCKDGYYADDLEVTCTFEGTATGLWGSNPCTRVVCTEGSDSSAAWVETPTGSSSNYTCEDGYFAANPTVECTFDGTATGVWGLNPCVQVTCAAGEDDTAIWDETDVGTPGSFNCKDGYYADISAVNCTQNDAVGVWGANPCFAVKCHAETFANAAWPMTLSATTATGTCLAGFSGTPTRACAQLGDTGVWEDVQKPCQKPPAGSSAAVVSIVFYIKNIDYTWVIASDDNRADFEAAFKNNLAVIFGVNAADITIVSITQGSAIVEYTVKTDDESAFRTSVSDFLASSNPSLDFGSLPSAALENSEAGTSLDPSQSSVKPNNTGAIVGGVIGGFVGLVLLIAIVVLIVRRRKDHHGPGRSKSREKVLTKEQVEMVD